MTFVDIATIWFVLIGVYICVRYVSVVRVTAAPTAQSIDVWILKRLKTSHDHKPRASLCDCV